MASPCPNRSPLPTSRSITTRLHRSSLSLLPRPRRRAGRRRQPRHGPRCIAGQCTIHWLDQSKRLPDRLSNLLSPQYYDPAFAAWLNDDLAPLIEATIGGPARHSSSAMLAGGASRPYLQGWHRDLGKPGEPDEVAYLKHTHGRFVQYNATLQPGDRFLNIVPASHLRRSTAAEIKAMNRKPFDRGGKTGPLSDSELKALEAWDAVDAMPGAMVVEMETGDIAFYNANLWHRGWNPRGQTRWTMHSAFWKPEYPVMRHEHGQREELLTAGHMDRMPAVTRGISEAVFGCLSGEGCEVVVGHIGKTPR